MIILILNLWLSTTYAQENLSRENGVRAVLKRSNLAFSLSDELASSSKINGFTNKVEAAVGYRITPIDSLKLTTAYFLSDTNLTSPKWNADATSLRYKRSKILSEQTSPVTFNSEFRLYAYPGQLKTLKNQSGNSSWRNSFSKKFNQIFKFSTELRWDEYFRTTSLPAVSRRKLMLTADPVYSINESLSLTPEFSFNSKFERNLNREYIVFRPMIDYIFSGAFSGQFYWETTPMISRDHNLLAKRFMQNGVLGMLLTYNLI